MPRGNPSLHRTHYSQHNRLNGSIQCARKIVEAALAAPTITPEAEAFLASALTALDSACTETYNRRLNPDGSLWVRDSTP